MRARAWIAAALLACSPGQVVAQDDLSMGQVRSPVLTIDVDRLLAGTAYGRRLAEDVRLRAAALDEENNRLRVELTEEERSLTERRPTMEVPAFRAEAEAFDQRVQQIRAEQDAKQQALNAALEDGRREFLNAVSPVLAGLMVDSGAAVILERDSVFLGAGLIDITDEAIAAIDAELGDGRALPAPEETGTPPAVEAPAREGTEPLPDTEAPAPEETEPPGPELAPAGAAEDGPSRAAEPATPPDGLDGG